MKILGQKLFIPCLLSVFLGFQPIVTMAFLIPNDSTNQGAGSSSKSSSSIENFLSASTSTSDKLANNQLGSGERIADQVPQVETTIIPTNPSPDQLVYAQASAKNFLNSPSKLYFNWYIFNENDKVGVTVEKDGQKIFIPSNTIEGALIRGAMAQARGSYIPGETPQAKDSGQASESFGKDQDGYQIKFGGDDGQGAIEKEITTILGKNYDFTYANFAKNCRQNCEMEYKNSQSENDWEYQKCAGSSCSEDLDNCCNGCKNDFSTCLDNFWSKVKDGCFQKICDSSDKNKKEDCYRSLNIGSYSVCNEDFFQTDSQCLQDRNNCCQNSGACSGKPTQECLVCERDQHKAELEALKEKDYCEKKCTVKENNSLGERSVEAVGTRCFRYNFGSQNPEKHSVGIFQPITCFHFAPGTKNPEDLLAWKDKIPFTAGDGSFKEDEETFWGTDPTNADTDGDGFPDEADIVGLGQQNIQFKYQNGDQLGVVVEGTSSFPTNEKTPYHKIMWAYSGVCDENLIQKMAQNNLNITNFCRCDKAGDEKNCQKSGDAGFGYLALKNLFQASAGNVQNNLTVSLNLNPLHPVVKAPFSIEAIAGGNQLEKNLLDFRWSVKYEGEILQAQVDQANSRIVWKKGETEVAQTKITNSLASFNGNEGMGWDKLFLEPFLEGGYEISVRVTEQNGKDQTVGENKISFDVAAEMQIKLFRASFQNGVWEKKNELTNQEMIANEQILAEYQGPFFDQFIWFLDKKKIEGNEPRILIKNEKMIGSVTNFKLIATSKNRNSVNETEINVKTVSPAVRLTFVSNDPKEKPNLSQNVPFEVPLDQDFEITAVREPAGSSFAERNDLTYFWSLDGASYEEGQTSYRLLLSSEKYLPRTPHSLGVKIYSSEKEVVGTATIDLFTVENGTTLISKDKSFGIGKMALVYLNLPDKLRFLLENFIWGVLVYFLLGGFAWFSSLGEKNRLNFEKKYGR